MTTRRMYTIEIHASNIRLMMTKEKPCILCPAGEDFYCGIQGITTRSEGKAIEKRMLAQWENNPCLICMDFSEIFYEGIKTEEGERKCPCQVLGSEETIKRAKEKLKAYPKEESRDDS